METKEAIMHLNDDSPNYHCCVWNTHHDKTWLMEAADRVKTALEKQTPMKPTGPIDHNWPNCPRCESFVGRVLKQKYCKDCGQAIDWTV